MNFISADCAISLFPSSAFDTQRVRIPVLWRRERRSRFALAEAVKSEYLHVDCRDHESSGELWDHWIRESIPDAELVRMRQMDCAAD